MRDKTFRRRKQTFLSKPSYNKFVFSPPNWCWSRARGKKTTSNTLAPQRPYCLLSKSSLLLSWNHIYLFTICYPSHLCLYPEMIFTFRLMVFPCVTEISSWRTWWSPLGAGSSSPTSPPSSPSSCPRITQRTFPTSSTRRGGAPATLPPNASRRGPWAWTPTPASGPAPLTWARSPGWGCISQ